MASKPLPTDILLELDTLPDGRAVSEKHAAVILGLSVSKLQKDRVNGGGPKFVKYGQGKGGRVAYLLGELRSFLRERTRESTSAYLATDGVLGELGLARPYAVVGGSIREFLNSLTDEPDDIVWLTADEAAAHRRSSK